MKHFRRLPICLLLLVFFIGCSQSPSSPKSPKKTSQKNTEKKITTKKTTNPKNLNVVAEEKSRLPQFFESKEKPADKPLPIYRSSDKRPKHDDARLKKFGIYRYESKRLLLYTDIDPEIAKTLPPLIDQAYIAWEEYFGKLAPDREKSEFQMTGYLIKDKELFKRAGLIPDDLRPFLNGRHRGQEFWMYEQKYDYYRRHLIIHETTHCFMTIIPDVNAPVWYMEGMAELFGTHRIAKDGKITFRIMPQTKEEIPGLGRITLINKEFANSRGKVLSGVTNLTANDFMETSAYAWSWGLCMYFDSHPIYAKRFRALGQYTTGSQFPMMMRKSFEKDLSRIRSEWILFAGNLQCGYDAKQSMIKYQTGLAFENNKNNRLTVQANRGWQSSQLLVEKGKVYDISSTGQFTLAQKPKPWVSEANGISFRYIKGKPIGQLLATVQISNPTTPMEFASMLNESPIGSQKKWKAPASGTLYFRLNDSWSELADNTGTVEVTVRIAQSE